MSTPPGRLVRRAFFLLAYAALTACNGSSALAPAPYAAQSSVQTGDLSNPPEVRSVDGVARLELSAVIDPATGAPALEFDGALVPPTIRIAPGDTIDIVYHNALPSSRVEPFNETNLHFHGLSVSPNAPADDAIGVHAMPGQTVRYRVPVPKTQPPGIYWYHSHAHGESNWQVLNGMSGAIVLDGTASFSKATAGLPERIIVLRNVLAHPNYRETLPHPRRPGAPCGKPFDIPGEYTTVNGRRAPVNVAMLPGRRQFWRVVNASADGYYDLSVDGATLKLVSFDGVPAVAYPGGEQRDVRDVVVPPAGRVEFVVEGAAPGAAFRTTCTDTGPLGDPNPSQRLGTIVGDPPNLPLVPAPGATPPAFGTYEETVGTDFAQKRTILFSENRTGTVFYLNGKRYAPSDGPMFTARAGTVERWTLLNFTREVHAFHIHQVHFIVHDIDGVRQPSVWWDTVNLPPADRSGKPSVTHVTVDFRNPIVRGTFLFHCHILQHEDLGMMAKIAVK